MVVSAVVVGVVGGRGCGVEQGTGGEGRWLGK